MDDLGKDMDRVREKVGKFGAYLASAEAKVNRLASKIDGVRQRYERAKAYWRDAVNSSKAVTGRKR